MTAWPVVERPLAAGGARVEQTTDHGRTVLRISAPAKSVDVQVEPIDAGKYQLTLPRDALDGLSDLWLQVDYEADSGMAFMHGRLVADNFHGGTPWLIGLKRFAPGILESGLCLVFHPLRQGAVKNVSSLLAGRTEFDGQEKLAVHSISVIPEYRARLG